jgi:hypothetical protein
MVDDQKEREDIEKATDAKSLVSMQGASRNLTLVRQDNRILKNRSKRKTRVPAFFFLRESVWSKSFRPPITRLHGGIKTREIMY